MESETENLQTKLAEIDLASRTSQKGSGMIEFLILKHQNLKIKMYKEFGHALPHLHIDYGHQNHVASYSISDGNRIAGTLSANYDRMITDWIIEHRDKLIALWHSAQKGEPIEELIVSIKQA